MGLKKNGEEGEDGEEGEEGSVDFDEVDDPRE
jgi:hypothetical protein